MVEDALNNYIVSKFFSLEELQKGTPDGVDPKMKEMHLSEVDFKHYFAMSKDEWMQQNDDIKTIFKEQHKLN